MTDKEILDIKIRVELATKGPWKSYIDEISILKKELENLRIQLGDNAK